MTKSTDMSTLCSLQLGTNLSLHYLEKIKRCLNLLCRCGCYLYFYKFRWFLNTTTFSMGDGTNIKISKTRSHKNGHSELARFVQTQSVFFFRFRWLTQLRLQLFPKQRNNIIRHYIKPYKKSIPKSHFETALDQSQTYKRGNPLKSRDPGSQSRRRCNTSYYFRERN